MSLLENIRLALRAIKSNLLRTILTLLIIAFGITALIGILTAIESLRSQVNASFSSLGANTFSIERKFEEVNNDGSQKPGPEITYDQAMLFKQRYNFPATVSISARVDGIATIRFGSEKTNPNVMVVGADENYFTTSGFGLSEGRFFNTKEIEDGASVAIIGKDVVEKIFTHKEDPVGQFVWVGDQRYRVIGLLASKGSSMISSNDREVMIPMLNALRNYMSRQDNVDMQVLVSDLNQMDGAIDEARGQLRNIRGLAIGDEDDFEINKSDALANELFSQLANIRIGAIFIGIITLIGAAIGLMNIMLVSVTERTMEIGVTKALGATRKMIRRQFLVEAISICLMGGLAGIVFGILIGNIVSAVLHGSFIIPWAWIGGGIVFCFFVGLIAGMYPAVKASKLDPIEALRYE